MLGGRLSRRLRQVLQAALGQGGEAARPGQREPARAIPRRLPHGPPAHTRGRGLCKIGTSFDLIFPRKHSCADHGDEDDGAPGEPAVLRRRDSRVPAPGPFGAFAFFFYEESRRVYGVFRSVRLLNPQLYLNYALRAGVFTKKPTSPRLSGARKC